MRFDSSARLALVVATVALVACGIGFRLAVGALNVYLQKEAVPLRGPLTRVPVALGPWQRHGDDAVLSTEIRQALGTDQYIDRDYRRTEESGVARLNLHVAYYTGMIDTVPHVPERCWGAGGMVMTQETFVMPLDIDRSAWRESDVVNRSTGQRYAMFDVIDPISRRMEQVHMPIGDFELRVTEFQSSEDPEQRLIGGYLFIANGRLTSSAFGVRALAFQATDRHAYYAKVQFSMGAHASDPNRFETFRELSSDLLNRLLPYLMRQLPDWPSVERSTPDGAEAVSVAPVSS